MSVEPREEPASEDPYVVLGLHPGASHLDIRTHYRAALRQHPPESDPEGFKRVRAAFEALRDPRMRARTTLLRRWLVPEVGAPTAEELGAGSVAPPSVAELAADLRWVAIRGTDLERTDFAADLRDPQW